MPVSKVSWQAKDQLPLKKWMRRAERQEKEAALKTSAELQALMSSSLGLTAFRLGCMRFIWCNASCFLLHFEDLKEGAGKRKHCQIKSHRRVEAERGAVLCVPFGLNSAQPSAELANLCVRSKLRSHTAGVCTGATCRSWGRSFIYFFFNYRGRWISSVFC